MCAIKIPDIRRDKNKINRGHMKFHTSNSKDIKLQNNKIIRIEMF